MTKFKLLVATYNAMPWLERCLDSIRKQVYRNFEVCVIDDVSTQPEQAPLIERVCKEEGWLYKINEKNQGAMANMLEAARLMDAQDEDVLVVADGDDWLANEWVLEKLNKIYSNEDVWLTYGQFLRYREGTIGCARELRKRVIRKRLFRKKGWVFSHLRSFKAFLWNNIRDEDLRDETGEYIKTTSDLATMFPMAEMAGERIRYIPEVLYIYNDSNPISDCKVYAEEQQRLNKRIRSMKKYDLLERFS